jgi:hypothetical protein
MKRNPSFRGTKTAWFMLRACFTPEVVHEDHLHRNGVPHAYSELVEDRNICNPFIEIEPTRITACVNLKWSMKFISTAAAFLTLASKLLSI